MSAEYFAPTPLNVLKPGGHANQVWKDGFALARQGGFGVETC